MCAWCIQYLQLSERGSRVQLAARLLTLDVFVEELLYSLMPVDNDEQLKRSAGVTPRADVAEGE